VTLVRFEQELQALAPQPGEVASLRLKQKYPAFATLFTREIIGAGDLEEEEGRRLVGLFLTDSMVLRSAEEVKKVFPTTGWLQKSLTGSFRHYLYYWPGKPLPVVYTCISGFNEPVFAAPGLIGISLDKFLGIDFGFYPLLGIPRYKQLRMIPERIPVEVMRTWGLSLFPISDEATTLLDHIIHQGKLLHFTEAMLPATPDTLLTGFTQKQLRWCRSNEAAMWSYLVENKLLFSTDRMDILRYTGDGPTTNGFPRESPARTGEWLGRQIIRSYLKNNPGIILPVLMENCNYQEILNRSGYMPQ